MVDNWQFRKRPARLERRVEFENYDLTRDFLDLAAELSEREGFYPDMNFGRTHVNMTIHIEGEDNELSAEQRRFAEGVNVFAPTNKIVEPINTDFTSEKE